MKSYYFLKSTNSYDRAVAVLRYLKDSAGGLFNKEIKSFLVQNAFVFNDYAAFSKEKEQMLGLEEYYLRAQDEFYKTRSQMWPLVECDIITDEHKNFFYFCFHNCANYEFLDQFLLTDEISNLKSIPAPAAAKLVDPFILTLKFFDPCLIKFKESDLTDYAPSVDWRAKEQIKQMLVSQIIAKHPMTSLAEVIKIKSSINLSDHAALIEKVKAALTKTTKHTFSN